MKNGFSEQMYGNHDKTTEASGIHIIGIYNSHYVVRKKAAKDYENP